MINVFFIEFVEFAWKHPQKGLSKRTDLYMFFLAISVSQKHISSIIEYYK